MIIITLIEILLTRKAKTLNTDHGNGKCIGHNHRFVNFRHIYSFWFV